MVDFLTRHGHKLYKLVIDLSTRTPEDVVPVFDLCPNVRELHLITLTPVRLVYPPYNCTHSVLIVSLTALGDPVHEEV